MLGEEIMEEKKETKELKNDMKKTINLDKKTFDSRNASNNKIQSILNSKVKIIEK